MSHNIIEYELNDGARVRQQYIGKSEPVDQNRDTVLLIGGANTNFSDRYIDIIEPEDLGRSIRDILERKIVYNTQVADHEAATFNAVRSTIALNVVGAKLEHFDKHLYEVSVREKKTPQYDIQGGPPKISIDDRVIDHLCTYEETDVDGNVALLNVLPLQILSHQGGGYQ